MQLCFLSFVKARHFQYLCMLPKTRVIPPYAAV
jgi:hypothetical protein